MTYDNIPDDALANASPESIFTAQNGDLKTTEKVLEALADEAREQGTDWLAENLEVSKEAVKEKRGVR